MREISVTAALTNGVIAWTANASDDGEIQHDTGSFAAATPLDALFLLASELYDRINDLEERIQDHYSQTLCDSLGGHNYNLNGVCLRAGCGATSDIPFRKPPRLMGETDADGR